MVMVSGINANEGKVQLDVWGLATAAAGTPGRLAVDVTRKPLIKMVWYGLWVVLAGGALSTFKRLRQSLRVDALPPAAR
jgi:cytochrome c biogenesis factor